LYFIERPMLKRMEVATATFYVSKKWNEGKIPVEYVPERRPPVKDFFLRIEMPGNRPLKFTLKNHTGSNNDELVIAL